MAASPRRTLTAEERIARDEYYRVEPKVLNERLKDMIAVFKALNALTSALAQGGPGAHLAFPNAANPQAPIEFNRRHLLSAYSQFSNQILGFKNYVRVAKKKTRAPVLPETLAGVFTPVYAAPALQAFFNTRTENFGAEDPTIGGAALMDNLPLVKQGFMLRNTSTMLFFIYARAQNLQDTENAQLVTSDEVMNAVFDSQDPALAAAFYSYALPGMFKTKERKQKDAAGNFVKDAAGNNVMEVVQEPKLAKITMAEAVASGMLAAPISTYEGIRRLYPDFNPAAQFNTYFFQNIAAANYYSKAFLVGPALEAIREQLDRDDVRQAMLDEHTLVKQVSEKWRTLVEPGRKVKRDARKKQKDAAAKALKLAAKK